MTKNALDSRRWVLPLVSIIPVLAILYAFSLGPSPRKRLQVVYQADSVDAAQLSALADGRPEVLEALTEDVQSPDVPHRAALVRFLGARKFAAAGPALRRLATSPGESAEVRTAALLSLKAIDPNGVRDLAKSLEREADPLGRAAQQVLAELSSDQS